MEAIYKEIFCLLMFSLTGITIGILFDIFRILRKSFKTADIITYLQDILFWIITGIIVLFSVFKFNNGEIRIYIFFGIGFGILVYMLTLSRIVIKYCVKIVKFAKKIFSYPVKIIIKIGNRIIVKPATFFIQVLTKKDKKIKE